MLAGANLKHPRIKRSVITCYVDMAIVKNVEGETIEKG